MQSFWLPFVPSISCPQGKVMSDESTSHSPEPQQSAARSGRSPVEKVIWCVIALVIFGLGLELYAKTSYENTMAAIDDVFNQPHPAPQHLSDVQKLISGLTRQGAAVQSESTSTQEEIKVTWLSPSNKYAFTLVLEKGSDDPVVAWYKMGSDNWLSDPNSVPPVDPNIDLGSPPEGMGGMMMGGAPGGPGGHQAEGGQPGGGQGGGRGRRPRGLLGILGEEAVIAEISLTPEQTEKVDGLGETLQVDTGALQEASAEERASIFEKARTDAEAALKEVLNESQFIRVWQIDLQRTGLGAVARPNVAAQLNLTDEQNGKLAEIIAEGNEARSAAMQERNFAAMGGIREQTDAKIEALLTDDQKAQWKELLGPPGPEPPQRGSFGGGGGGGRGGAGGGPGSGDGGRPRRPAADDSSDSEPATDANPAGQ
jgi:hypothetical protein